MKNNKLRVAWILPNVMLYLLLVGLTAFILLQAEGLQESGELIIYVIFALLLGLVTVGGSLRIRHWVKAGKM